MGYPSQGFHPLLKADVISEAQAVGSRWIAGEQLREAEERSLESVLTGEQLSLGTVLVMRADADQVKQHVASGHQSNFPIHAGSEEAAQIFAAAASSLVVVESVPYVVVAVAEYVLTAVLVAATVISVVAVFDAEVPAAAVPAVVSAVAAVGTFAAAAFAVAPVAVVAAAPVAVVADAPVAVVAAVVGNSPVYCNSNSARSDCPEQPDSIPLPSSAWAVQKLSEKVAAQNSLGWTVRAAADLTLQAFVFAESPAAVPSPCPGQVWSYP